MRLACLISGGKDSLYAAYVAKQAGYVIDCFLTVLSKNKESYMFHTPNTNLTKLQAEATGIPIVVQETSGEKEVELNDLRKLLCKAKERGAEGIVTGAIASVYQASRVQKLCLELNLWCFNPLWQTPPEKHLENLLRDGFEAIVVAVAAYPLDEKWLGRRLDANAVKELLALRDVSPIGEGGEYETFVTNCPLFKKKIRVEKTTKTYSNHAGTFNIMEAVL